MFPTEVILPPVTSKRGRHKKKRALSASERFHCNGLKRVNLQLDSKVIICGACQKPGHNRRTCHQALKHFTADKSFDDMFDAAP